MVAFASQSKRATLRDSQLDEMGVKHGLKQDDKGNQNSLYNSLYTSLYNSVQTSVQTFLLGLGWPHYVN
jgi:hypothetical protein